MTVSLAGAAQKWKTQILMSLKHR